MATRISHPTVVHVHVLSACPQAGVSRWAKQLAEGGMGRLKKAGRAGRKPRLSPADLRRVESGLKHGAEPLGYAVGCGRPAG